MRDLKDYLKGCNVERLYEIYTLIAELIVHKNIWEIREEKKKKEKR